MAGQRGDPQMVSIDEEIKYASRGSILTPTECAFWQELNKVLPRTVMACPKVRVSDLVSARTWKYGPHNRINQKHVDFVLTDASSGEILGVVELDDETHLLPDRQARDEFLDGVLAKAGIKILRVNRQDIYSLDGLSREINNLLSRSQHLAA
jgi:very-short-patch-repair endonuclease